MSEAEFLLALPSPVDGIEQHISRDNTLNISFEAAADLATRYYESVELHLRCTAPQLEQEVIPALAFALRLFNAENFSGELTPSERARYAHVLRHFGGVVEKGYVGTEEEEESETVQKNKNEEEAAVGAGATATVTPPAISAAPAKPGKAFAEERAKLQDLFLQRLLTTDGEVPVAAMRLPGLLLCILGIAKAELEAGAPLLPLTSLWRLRSFFATSSASRTAPTPFFWLLRIAWMPSCVCQRRSKRWRCCWRWGMCRVTTIAAISPRKRLTTPCASAASSWRRHR